MTHTEALKMARETLAEVTDILDMALMIGLPTLPPGADGPAVKARAAIAALDALQSAQPATHTEALRALLSAVDMLTYPGEDQPQDPEPWGDWNNGNGDLCGPAMAAAIARARKALAQPSAPPAKINVLLPDGDSRTVTVMFTERLADGSINLCITVDPEPQPSAPSVCNEGLDAHRFGYSATNVAGNRLAPTQEQR